MANPRNYMPDKNAPLVDLLRRPLDPAFAPVVELLTQSEHPEVIRLVLSFLAQAQPPAAIAKVVSRRADWPFLQAFLQDPHDAALVRDTITPTVLAGSSKTNVIPPSAPAERRSGQHGRRQPGSHSVRVPHARVPPLRRMPSH